MGNSSKAPGYRNAFLIGASAAFDADFRRLHDSKPRSRYGAERRPATGRGCAGDAGPGNRFSFAGNARAAGGVSGCATGRVSTERRRDPVSDRARSGLPVGHVDGACTRGRKKSAGRLLAVAYSRSIRQLAGGQCLVAADDSNWRELSSRRRQFAGLGRHDPGCKPFIVAGGLGAGAVGTERQRNRASSPNFIWSTPYSSRRLPNAMSGLNSTRATPC